MLQALINGTRHLKINETDILEIVEPRPKRIGEAASITARLLCNGECRWSRTLEDFWSEPTLEYDDSRHVGFRGLFWSAADAIMLGGSTGVLCLAHQSGQIVGRIDMEFSEKESLNFLHMAVFGEVALIAGPSGAYLLDRSFSIRSEWSPTGNVLTATLGENVLLVEEMSSSPPFDVATRSLRITSGGFVVE